MHLRKIIPYGVSAPCRSGLKLRRGVNPRVQEGPAGTLHPKTSQKPNPGEVVVVSSLPLVDDDLRSPVVPVSQEGSDVPSEDGGLVAPEATCEGSLVLPWGPPLEVEVGIPVIENDTAAVQLRRRTWVMRKPHWLDIFK